MSSTENHQKSLSEGLQIPGLVQSPEPVEQLSFTNNPTTPMPASLVMPSERVDAPDLADADTARQPAPNTNIAYPVTPLPASAPGSTRALILNAQPEVTQALSEAVTQAHTGPLRRPVIIRGSQKERRSPRPPQGRRHVIGTAAIILLVLITGGTLFAASPAGHDAGFGFGQPISAIGSLIKSNNNNSMNLIMQQATATAVVHQANDGLVPSASNNGPVVTGSPETWPLGVCTYWANLRYHELTGYWVTWLGNAYQWAQGASEAGWHVSSSPHIPSIVVLQPGVQGASGYGHVAVAEKLVNSTTVETSNMNWYTNGGGWDIVSDYDFSTGPGVSFIWK